MIVEIPEADFKISIRDKEDFRKAISDKLNDLESRIEVLKKISPECLPDLSCNTVQQTVGLRENDIVYAYLTVTRDL